MENMCEHLEMLRYVGVKDDVADVVIYHMPITHQIVANTTFRYKVSVVFLLWQGQLCLVETVLSRCILNSGYILTLSSDR